MTSFERDLTLSHLTPQLTHQVSTCPSLQRCCWKVMLLSLHPNIIVHVENVVSLFSSPSTSSQKARKCGSHKFLSRAIVSPAPNSHPTNVWQKMMEFDVVLKQELDYCTTGCLLYICLYTPGENRKIAPVVRLGWLAPARQLYDVCFAGI